MTTFILGLLRTVLAGAALAAAAPILAQDLPTKQMRIVVPYAPGGTTDILGRALAQRLGERLNRVVVVDNRAGAGGSLGTEVAVRSDPDGSTILLHSGAITIEPSIKRNLSYDTQRDLTPVTLAVVGPFALLVNPKLPMTSVAELISYAKAHPGKLNFGTPGIGSSVHLTTEYFKSAAGIDILHVPYKGASLALAATMADEVQIIIDPLTTSKPLAQAGKLRALALTTGERSELWPELPTLAESGVRNFDAAVWYGLFVPAKTPPATVSRLNAEFVAILQSAEMKSWLREQGLQSIASTPDQARKTVAAEVERWAGVIKSAGIKVE
ncbi:MAG: tripartite tricarboxylate transporter substrate binding protein [Burkholderiaceae bacterium]